MSSHPDLFNLQYLPCECLTGFRGLLRMEADRWRSRLHWDISPTLHALEAAASAGSLPGIVAVVGSSPVGYMYWVRMGPLTTLGSVFSVSGDIDAMLLRNALASVTADRTAQRIEGQLLHFGGEDLDPVFREFGFAIHGRCYMVADLAEAAVEAPDLPAGYRILPFEPASTAKIADLIHRSYVGEVDSSMSRCYRTPRGCKGFLESIIGRNGIGRFTPGSSFTATAPDGEVCGVVLLTAISPGTAHVPQISIHPDHQGMKLGRLLLATAMRRIMANGFSRLSLSVTRDNFRAFRLYTSLGFQTVLFYPAVVRER